LKPVEGEEVAHTVNVYEKPTLRLLGSLHELTLGGPFSCADGNSGSAGNNGCKHKHKH
jgi:hypothetical protein